MANIALEIDELTFWPLRIPIHLLTCWNHADHGHPSTFALRHIGIFANDMSCTSGLYDTINIMVADPGIEVPTLEANHVHHVHFRHSPEAPQALLDLGAEIARVMVQGHLALRGSAEQKLRVVGSDGVERREPRETTRKLQLLVGNMVVPRLLHQAAGVEGLAPQDGALSLARDSFSMGVRRRLAEEALRGSFDQVAERIGATTGAHIAKRQAEQLVLASAVDFEAFYLTEEWQPENCRQRLTLTFDGAGVIMRLESLREQTRNKASEDAAQPEAWPQRLKAGEKAAHCLHNPGTDEARAWVAERARMLLEGADPSQVATGMRRSATRQGLTQRKAIDVCARYLKKRRATIATVRP